MRLPRWMDRFNLRRALQAAGTATLPAIQPPTTAQVAEDDDRCYSTPGAKVPRYSKARLPMPDDADSARINAAINKEALLERLEWWADVLQKKRSIRFLPNVGDMLPPYDQFYRWVSLYLGVELEQGYAKRQNVTGLGPKLPRLTPDEIADARTAGGLASKVQAIERDRATRLGRWRDELDPGDEDPIEGSIVDALGGDAQILAACHGNAELVELVKARARQLLRPKEKINA